MNPIPKATLDSRSTQKKITLFFGFFALCWLLFSAMRISSLHEMKLSVLTDPTGLKTFEEIIEPAQQANFISYPQGFARGYTRDTHWIKFTFYPLNPSTAPEAFLEIQPPYLDTVQIFWPDSSAKGGYHIYNDGDLIAANEREQRYRGFLNKIKINNTLPITAYIRLKTTSSSIIFVRVWYVEELITAIQLDYLWIGLFFGLLLSSLASNFWLGLWKKHTLYRAHIFYMFNTCMALFFSSGMHNVIVPLLPADVGHHAVSITSIFVVISCLYFYRHVLDLKNSHWLIDWANRIPIYASLLALPSPFLDLYPELARWLLPMMLLSLTLNFFRIIQLRRSKESELSPVLIAHLFSLGGYLFSGLTLLGVLPGQAWIVYGYQASMLGVITSLQWMMTQRTRVIEQNQAAAYIMVERAHAQAEYERMEREQQRRFLAMLTHELRTPLSFLRMYMGSSSMSEKMRPHAIGSINAINALIERCGLVSSIDEKRVNLQSRHLQMNDMIHEIISQTPAAADSIKLDTAELPILSTDPLLLRIIISNLIEKAIKYSAPQSDIFISTQPHYRDIHCGVLLTVKNSIGAAGQPDTSQLFDKYYRSPGARAQAGSGLGLYIVQELCTLLSIDIQFLFTHSEACFELWIPQHPPINRP